MPEKHIYVVIFVQMSGIIYIIVLQDHPKYEKKRRTC